jgi:hypothetical protein
MLNYSTEIKLFLIGIIAYIMSEITIEGVHYFTMTLLQYLVLIVPIVGGVYKLHRDWKKNKKDDKKL